MTVYTQSTIYDIIYALQTHASVSVLAPMVGNWLREVLVNLVTFQWAGWLIRLPTVRPDLVDSVVHAANLPDRLGEGGGLAGMLTIDELLPTTAVNPFWTGLLNSPALVVPISTTSVFCFRWLALEGLTTGSMAFVTALLANWLLLVCVLFGFDEIVARWYFLSPFTYIFGVLFFWRLMWNWCRRGPNFDLRKPAPFNLNPGLWRRIKTVLSAFVLSLTEQTTLFTHVVQPIPPHQLNIFQSFTTGSSQEYVATHIAYAGGLLVGGLLLTVVCIGLAFTALNQVNPVVLWLNYKFQLELTTNFHAITTWMLLFMVSVSVPYYSAEFLASSFTGLTPGTEQGWSESFKYHFIEKTVAPFSRQPQGTGNLKKIYFQRVEELPYNSDQVPLNTKYSLYLDRAWAYKADFGKTPNRGLLRFIPVNRKKLVTHQMWDSMMKKFQLNEYNRTVEANTRDTDKDDLDWLFRAYMKEPTPEQMLDGKMRREIRKYIAYNRGRVARLTNVPVGMFVRDQDGEIDHKIKHVSMIKDKDALQWFTSNKIKGDEAHIKDVFRWGIRGPTIRKNKPKTLEKKQQRNTLEDDPDDFLDVNLGGHRGYLAMRFFKNRFLQNPWCARVMNFEADSLIAEQPNRYFVTDSEMRRLEYHRAMLACYHRSLREYKNSIFVGLLNEAGMIPERDHPTLVQVNGWQGGLRAKSLENYVYAQQFRGNHRLVARLFFRSEDWADNPSGEPIFRYDQLLPLEDEDRAERSPIWHVDFPQDLREELGAYDPYKGNRVSPMFDPMPFYIAWDPALHKSVLTTSRLPQGEGFVRVAPPDPSQDATSKPNDWLGIKRFLEETKIYENLDLRATEDDKILVPAQTMFGYHLKPALMRQSPGAGAVFTPGLKFKLLPDEPDGYEKQLEARRRIILGLAEPTGPSAAETAAMEAKLEEQAADTLSSKYSKYVKVSEDADQKKSKKRAKKNTKKVAEEDKENTPTKA